ncbi:MAG: hypothetical protein H0X33_13305 [Taibaiella sp.]|nr:hypothetical protein [Taibaiella sp.]
MNTGPQFNYRMSNYHFNPKMAHFTRPLITKAPCPFPIATIGIKGQTVVTIPEPKIKGCTINCAGILSRASITST